MMPAGDVPSRGWSRPPTGGDRRPAAGSRSCRWPPGPRYAGDRLAFVYNVYTEPAHRRRGLARPHDGRHSRVVPRPRASPSMALNASRRRPAVSTSRWATVESPSPMMFLIAGSDQRDLSGAGESRAGCSDRILSARSAGDAQTMPFIITDPCIETKDTACVDVCPVDCIHPRKDEPEFAQTTMLYIHPEECIDCGACVPACPVAAIYESIDATPAASEGSDRGQRDLPQRRRRHDGPGRSDRQAHVAAHADIMAVPAAERRRHARSSADCSCSDADLTADEVATWNVNGIRARHAQVQEWIARERPDVVCLQEIKATSDQIPELLLEMEGYWCYWHGGKGYSGVGLHVSRAARRRASRVLHPEFDFENRIVAVELAVGDLTVASIYVPNGGKDFPAKMRFLEALDDYAASFAATGRAAGALRRPERRPHRPGRASRRSGSRARSASCPRSARCIERILGRGLVDLGRALDPDNDGLFSWWAPWRNMRQRNIGWRLDYVIASAAARRAAPSAVRCRWTSAPATTRRSWRRSLEHGSDFDHHEATKTRRHDGIFLKESVRLRDLRAFVTDRRRTGHERRPRTVPPLRPVRHAVGRELDHVSQHGDAAGVPAGARRGAARRWGSPTPALDEHGYVMATVPATTKQGRGAGDRIHRARGHLAGDERRERRADRPRALRRPRPRRCPTIAPPSSGSPTTPRSRSRSATTSSPPRARRCSARTTRPASPRSSRAAAYLIAHPDIPHGTVRIAFTPDEEIGRGARTSTSRGSAAAAPTPWTAAAGAKSKARASPPTR